MLIIAGLGNPGPDYARHRHNVGFMVADAIADQLGLGATRGRYQSEVREGVVSGKKIIVMKPMTFMNQSGRALGEVVRFFKLSPTDVIVMHDELDLAPGKVKIKTGGGVAGHNGLKSIASHIGADFRRVRVGIGHPGDKARVHKYVLSDFKGSDKDWLEPLIDALAAECEWLLAGDDSRYATAIAQRLQPQKKEKKPKADQGSPAADEASSEKE